MSRSAPNHNRLSRRHFLASTSALACLVPFNLPASFAQATGGPPPGTSDDNTRLKDLFETIFQEFVAESPELATSLGLDRGANAGLKSKLDGRDAQSRADDLARNKKALSALAGFEEGKLSPANRLNREVVVYTLEAANVAGEKFGIDSVQRPYRIFQQGGAYFQLPDFLNRSHTIKTAEDCDAYLSRMRALARALDEDSAEQKAQAARGLVAPGWSIDLTLGQMEKLRAPALAENSIVTSLSERAKAANITGNWAQQAQAILQSEILPALSRQIELMKSLRANTPKGDGAQRLPDGEAIYAAALEAATTTKFTPKEVHRIGREQVAELSAELDKILKSQGMTKGSVGARLAAFNQSAAQLYANDDAGRAALIDSLNVGVKAMYARLPQAFSALPTQPLEIRRVPVEIQDGASNGYYSRASLDGSRPAIYFINLKDTGDWPKYSLPSLTYHEGVPGHHLQISLAQESADIPTLRKIGGFSSYSEGWALYSEQLADELGGYQAIERAGYLQSFLFRAARLVIDTGLHTQNWSREKATRYMVATTGFALPRSQREIERYCTQIGQACSYKIGHIAWLRSRDQAKKMLGDKFDIKAFHDVLKEGAMPLSILEKRIEERTRAMLI